MKTAYKQTDTLQKLADSRNTDMDRLKELAGIGGPRRTQISEGSAPAHLLEDAASRLKKFTEEAQKVMDRKLKELKYEHTAFGYSDSGPKETKYTVFIKPSKLTLKSNELVCPFDLRFEPKDAGTYYPTEDASRKLNNAMLKALSGLAKQHDIQMYPVSPEKRYGYYSKTATLDLTPLVTKASNLFNEDEIEKQANAAAAAMRKKEYEFMYSYGKHIGGNGWDEPREYDENYATLSGDASVAEIELNDDGNYVVTFDVDFGDATDSDVRHSTEDEAKDEFQSDFLWTFRGLLPGLEVELVDSDDTSMVFELTLAR